MKLPIEYKVEPKNLLDLMLAGDAKLTFISLHTQKHITFFIKGDKFQAYDYKVYYDNHFIGRLSNMQFQHYPKELPLSKENEAFEWIWKYCCQPERMAKNLDIYHNGNCARCGRVLTTPESILIGLGPECVKLINK